MMYLLVFCKKRVFLLCFFALLASLLSCDSFAAERCALGASNGNNNFDLLQNEDSRLTYDNCCGEYLSVPTESMSMDDEIANNSSSDFKSSLFKAPPVIGGGEKPTNPDPGLEVVPLNSVYVLFIFVLLYVLLRFMIINREVKQGKKS